MLQALSDRDGSIRSSNTGTDTNTSSTVSRYQPSTEREVRVVWVIVLESDEVTIKGIWWAELNDSRPGHPFAYISCPYERVTPASPGRKPS
jgi:hypothetical protein